MIFYVEMVTSSCMNLLVITNVCSRRLIYNSLHKIHSIVHSEAYVVKYSPVDL